MTPQIFDIKWPSWDEVRIPTIDRSWLVTGGVASAAFILSYSYMRYRKVYSFWSSRGIPGPTPVPIFGNSLEMFWSPSDELDIKNGRKYGRIYGTYQGARPVLLVSDPDVIFEIYYSMANDFGELIDFESGDPIDTNNVLAVTGDDWKRQRAIVTHGLTPAKIKQMFRSTATNDLREYIKMNEGKDDINMYHMISLHVLNIITRGFYGLDLDLFKNEHHALICKAQNMFNITYLQLFLGTELPYWISSLLGAGGVSFDSTEYVKQFVSHAVNERIKNSGSGEKKKDFLQILLDAKHDDTTDGATDGSKDTRSNTLSQIEVLSNAVLMLSVAFDTIAMSSVFFSYRLAKNPHVQQKIQEEIDRILMTKDDQKIQFDDLNEFVYLEAAIQESIRMNPIDQRGFRKVSASNGVTLPKVKIHLPKGTQVQTTFYSLHHDEEFYPDPEEFQPERFLAENKKSMKNCSFMSFGAGARMCPGMKFAYVNMKYLMIEILKDYSFVPTKSTPEKIVFKRGALFAHASHVFLKIVKRTD